MAPAPSRSAVQQSGAVALVVVAAVALYTRFSRFGMLGRDEAIYVYGGERLAHGVPPYVSIVDPKNPGATLLCGAAVALGRAVGVNAVAAIRVEFLVLAVLTAVAVYALGRVAWGSTVGGLAGAAVFASFRAFAQDAFVGPDALVPGIALLAASLALALSRRWLWAGVAAGLAFVVWQPLLIYPAVIVLGALWTARGSRLRSAGRALLGAAIPVAAVAVYFAIAGAFGDWIVAAFLQPATVSTWIGFEPGIRRVTRVVGPALGPVGHALFWAGSVLLVVAVVVVVAGRGRGAWRDRLTDPRVPLLLGSFVLILAFSVVDFLHYAHLYPLLPYPPLGVAAIAAFLARDSARALSRPAVRAAVIAGVVVAGLALTGYSAVYFTHDVGRSGGGRKAVRAADAENNPRNHRLREQVVHACELSRLAGSAPLYSLGDPTPLALTGRVNPDRYVYFQGGVLRWKLDHLRGGFDAWTRQILAARPAVIVVATFEGPLRTRIDSFLAARYATARVGQWQVYYEHSIAGRAAALGITSSGITSSGITSSRIAPTSHSATVTVTTLLQSGTRTVASSCAP